MEITMQDKKDYITAKNKMMYLEDVKDKTLSEHIFMHEAGNDIGGVESIRSFLKQGIATVDDFKDELKETLPRIYNSMSLHPITDIKKITPETVLGNSNLYEILSNQKEMVEKAFGYDVNLSIDANPQTHYNPHLLKALVFTNIGDAIKWTPKGEKININLSEENQNLKLTIENKVSSSPKAGIGQNQGTGTKYTNSFLEAASGSIKTGLIDHDSYKTFRKEIILPKN